MASQPKPRKRRTPTGRFAICSASDIAHDRVACEVYANKTGEHYFLLCGECMGRCFLNTWEEGWGWTLHQVTFGTVLPDGRPFLPARVVGLSPARRIELEMAEGWHRRPGS